MKTLSIILKTIVLIFIIDVCVLAAHPKSWEENLPVPPISAIHFQITVPDNFEPQNKDSVELIEKLVVTVKQLRLDLALKDAEITTYKEKIAQLESLNRLSEQQLSVANKIISTQETSFNLLKEKVDNLEKIVNEYKEANATLQNKVKNEKRLGNIKVLVTTIALLALKFL